MKNGIGELLIRTETTVKESLDRLNKTSEKILYVVDSGNRLLGSLTDGDIRRGLLRGVDIEEKIEKIYFKNAKYVKLIDRKDIEKIKNILLKNAIESIPVLNNEGIVVDIIYWVDLFRKEKRLRYEKKDNKVFILAGGLGTRLQPFTNILPKPLIPFGEKPILSVIMDEFEKYGFNKFILSLNYKAEMIKMYLNDPELQNGSCNIEYIVEDKPLGTIGSLKLIEEKIDGNFFISNSDIIIREDLERILNYHEEKNAALTITGCLKNTIIPYGVLETNEEGLLVDIQEKPVYKHFINTGVYVATKEIMKYIKKNERCDITEVIKRMKDNGEKICTYPLTEDKWIDVGQWEEYKKAKEFLNF